jgi:hypothetical protein
MSDESHFERVAQTYAAEMMVYEYVRRRLPVLVAGDEELCQRLHHLKPVIHGTVFSLFYKEERKGKLFDFWKTEGGYHFEFIALGAGTQLQTGNLSDIDANLLAAYKQRVQELG